MIIDELILGYEMDFFKKAFCDDIQNLENRIHDDFMEFGNSGKVYDKNSIIHFLNHLSTDRDIKIQNFVLKYIKDDILMANYISNAKETETKALRTSIWIKENADWKLYFHQGTSTELNTYEQFL